MADEPTTGPPERVNPPRPKRGAKSKLTPVIQSRVCRLIGKGLGRGMAARRAGIGESTFYSWMAAGESEETGSHREFLEAVLRAEDEHCERLADGLDQLAHNAGNEGVRLAAIRFALERRHPDDWSQRKEVRNTGPDGGPVKMEHSGEVAVSLFTSEQLAAMSPEQLETAIRALVPQGEGKE